MSWQREALVTIEQLRARLRQVEYEQKEPIAIVGMGCRYPGGVGDPGMFWRLLDEGIDAVTEVPRERWDVDAFYDPDPDAPGKMTTRSGGFLAGIDLFDPGFFGISPREAVSMDPQQRLLLETSCEALERAGIAAERLVGSSTGVFVGLNYQEYGMLVGGLERLDGYVGTGTTASVASGRISYVLGLQGPSMTVDTACSSSLVTVHLACQALRQGECSLALAGGVTLMLTPGPFVEFSRLRGLAADGHCKTFSANADGTTLSEGCGMVVLERLSEARRHGHRVLAVIRGSAVNQDGRSNGLTAPNGPSQEGVIRRALAQAGVKPLAMGYVECHGTGTKLGDPIEVQALGSVLSEGREADRPVIIGSIKSNLGHTQAAAGVAGLIKVVLSLQHGRIPKNLHFEAPNPHIAWDELPVKVASEAVPWVRNGVARIAGVSSFGVSGTNAHVIVEEAPVEAQTTPQAAPARERSAELIVVSAKSASALEASSLRLAQHIGSHPEQTLGDIAYSLATTRTHHEHRLSLAVGTREQLVSGLEAVSRGELAVGSVRGEVRRRGKTAWLFTGQGSQHVGMGRGLYEEWPVFREAFDAACAALDPHLEGSLREVMWADASSPSLLDETGWTQPALFALEVGLASLWRSWGVEPDVVAGHSIGELSAAYVAGVFSLADAARLVAARGRLMQALPREGAMVSIAASEAEVAEAVGAQGSRVSIAAVNGPLSVVVSGEEASVLAVSAAFAAKGARTNRLRVSHAFHSALMEPMLEEFRRVADSVAYGPAQIRVVSNISGKEAGSELSTAEYWVRHVREGVRFADGVMALHVAGVTEFLELGPRPTLLGLVPGCLPEGAREPGLVASLRPERAESTAALDALGAHHAHGGQLEWKGVFPSGGARVELPTYPWQRQRYWIEASASRSGGVATGHPLLRVRLSIAGAGAVYESVLSRAEHSWLYDHRVGEAALMPGAGVVELVRAAGEHSFGEPVEVLSLVLQSPLVLPEHGGQRVQLVVGEQDGRTEVSVYSQPAEAAAETEWTRHASGEVRRSSAEGAPRIDLAAVRARCAEGAAVTQAYEGFASIGLDYGPAFQGLQSLSLGTKEAIAEVSLPEGVDGAERYGVHPALLDAAFQSSLGAVAGTQALYLPFAMDRVTVHASGATAATVYARMRQEDVGVGSGEGLASDVMLTDAHGRVLVEVAGLRGRISRTTGRNTTMSGYGSEPDSRKKVLLKVISEVTGLSEADVLDVDDFQDLGIDSILRIQLANRLLALSPQTKVRSDEIVAVPSFSSLLSAFAIGGNLASGGKPTHDDRKNVIPANEPADDGSASDEKTDLDNTLTEILGGPENAVCRSLRVSGDRPLTVAGTLVVDETHPFFFDHPLDHVSGVHLIEAVNQICHVANRIEGGRYLALTAAKFAFNSFCEKNTHATVQVSLEGMQATRNYSCLVTQGGRKLLTGRCSFSSIDESETSKPNIAAQNYPLCRKSVVNKTHEQNVFISELSTQTGNTGCWVRPVGDNRTFNCAQKDRLIDAAYLIEACRQSAKLFAGRTRENDALRNSSAASGPGEMLGVLKSIEISMRRPVGIRDAVFLAPGESTVTSAGTNSLVDSRCNLFVDDIQVGSFDMRALVLSANTYANWREAGAKTP